MIYRYYFYSRHFNGYLKNCDHKYLLTFKKNLSSKYGSVIFNFEYIFNLENSQFF